MRQSAGVTAEFVEEKHIALLSAPLSSRGWIYFAPPDALLRITTQPSDTRLLISRDDVRYRDDAGADRFDITANSVARQFVENFLVLFTGDLERLGERYDIESHFDDQRWRLGLRPLRTPFDRLVESVALVGRGDVLESIEMIEKDGDRTVTRIVEMNRQRVFSREELERMFAE